jgi:hypothetical protein
MKRTLLGYIKNIIDPSINLSPWNKEYKQIKIRVYFGKSCYFISCLWSSVCHDSSLSFFGQIYFCCFFVFLFFLIICNCSFYMTFIHLNIMDAAS